MRTASKRASAALTQVTARNTFSVWRDVRRVRGKLRGEAVQSQGGGGYYTAYARVLAITPP
eukprot:3391116-Prymnesium_polylepis.1